MKTRKAARPYTCYFCNEPILKGDQYAKKTVRLGDQGIAFDGKQPRTWEPYRAAMPCCNKCANP